MRRARAASAAWTAGLVAAATVALMAIVTFMVHVHRDWGRRPLRSETAPASMPPVARPHPEAVPAPAKPGTAVREDEAPVAGPVAAGVVVETLRARSLAVPVSGVSAAALVRSFDQARDDRVHEALDIMAPAGTPVVAVEDGTIAKLFTSKAGGLTLYQFDPSRSVAYYYAHLQGYAAGMAEGAVVRRGQVIGYVGSSGNANPDAPHLHFAIFVLGPDKHWWQGTAIDPYPVLK